MHEDFKDKGSALGRFIEECGEVLAAAGKTVRYGWHSYNPLLPVEQRETNEDWLRREMEDLESAIARLKKSRGWELRVRPEIDGGVQDVVDALWQVARIQGMALIVTPGQYAEGYFERIGAIAYHRSYMPIRKLSDGNWVVQAPRKPQAPVPQEGQ